MRYRVRARFLSLVLLGASCGTEESAEAPPQAHDVARDAAPLEGHTVTGTAPRATGGFPSVVAFFLEDEVEPAPEPSGAGEPDSDVDVETALMDQYGNAFHPSILVVGAGVRISFRNSEDVLHNVRVVDRERHDTIFNVATPVVGSYEHRFEVPGVYDVSCQIHPSMAAFIYVTEASRAVVAEARGAFVADGLRPGAYRVTVWNLDAGRRRERRLRIDGDRTLDLTEGDEP